MCCFEKESWKTLRGRPKPIITSKEQLSSFRDGRDPDPSMSRRRNNGQFSLPCENVRSQMRQNFCQDGLATTQESSSDIAATNVASVEYSPTTLQQGSVSPCCGFADWSSGTNQPRFADLEAPLDLSMRGSETSSTRSAQTTERLPTSEETVKQSDSCTEPLAAADRQDVPPLIRVGREQDWRKAEPPFPSSDMERMRKRLAKEIFVPLKIVQWDCS